MRRSVVIEDWLYSLSSYGIKLTELRDPSADLATVLWYPASVTAETVGLGEGSQQGMAVQP